MLEPLYHLLGVETDPPDHKPAVDDDIIRPLIDRFPALSFTGDNGVDVSFMPCGEVDAGKASHAYAVPYVDGSDECLVARRADGEWTIHGGTMEPGESGIEALPRELLEETGARIGSVIPMGAYRCACDTITYRIVTIADVTLVQNPADPDIGKPSAIADAAALFEGRNRHFRAIYEMSQILR